LTHPALFHHSDQPLTTVDSRDQENAKRRWKPWGLWVSVDVKDNWVDWCKAEEFALEKLEYQHLITLRDPTELLWITTALDLIAFTEEYGDPLEDRFLSIDIIDWAKVAKEYPGIVIAPYQWSQRMELMWYYGWDCASGCIWDAAVIAEVGPALSFSDVTAQWADG